MVIARNFFESPLDQYLGSFGIIIMIGGIFFQDVYARVAISSFQHLYLIIEPPAEANPKIKRRGASRRHFYFTSYDTNKISRKNEADRFMTTLYSAMPFKHRLYGTVDRIFIYHNLPLIARLQLRQGTAAHAGMSVDHGQSDYLVIYEIAVPFIEYGKNYPQYSLIVGGGDFPYIHDILKTNYTSSPKLKQGV